MSDLHSHKVTQTTPFADLVNIPTGLENNKIFNKLLSIERGFWQSTGRSGASRYIDKYFASKGVIISPSDAGFWITIPKKDYKKLSLESPVWNYCKFKNIGFKQVSSDLAIILYHVIAIADINNPYGVLVCSTYQKNSDGIWKVLSSHHNLPYSPGVDNDELQEMIGR